MWKPFQKECTIFKQKYASDWDRTNDLSVNSRMLLPTELRQHLSDIVGILIVYKQGGLRPPLTPCHLLKKRNNNRVRSISLFNIL